MNVSEYSIGDWIYDRYRDCNIVVDGYLLHYMQDYDYYPVMLTEQILKANGFDIDTDDTYNWNEKVLSYLDTNTQQYFDIIMDTTNRLFYVEIGINKYNIQCVHQLQHLLRICGLETIADNFNVDV